MDNLKIRRVAIYINPQISRSLSVIDEMETFFQEYGVESTVCTSCEKDDLQSILDNNGIQAVIVVGGDGTMLRASHLCSEKGIPITGINLGTFGFLFEIQKDNWKEYLTRLIQGDFRVEQRMMLQAKLLRGKKELATFEVINEIVVCRGNYVKPIHIHTQVDEYPMASYVADGIIAATATGSTAYALAVNGPIMPPETRNILLVPVAPHLSFDRAVILPETTRIKIVVQTDHQAVLSADGRDPVTMKSDDVVEVTASEKNMKFIRFHDPGFFYKNLNRYMKQNPSVKNR